MGIVVETGPCIFLSPQSCLRLGILSSCPRVMVLHCWTWWISAFWPPDPNYVFVVPPGALAMANLMTSNRLLLTGLDPLRLVILIGSIFHLSDFHIVVYISMHPSASAHLLVNLGKWVSRFLRFHSSRFSILEKWIRNIPVWEIEEK